MKPTYLDAVYNLLDGKINGGKADGPISEITLHEGQTPPTESAIQSKLVELISAWNAQAYSRNRQAEYPSIQECVHAILDDDLTALQEKRQAVKTKYPKS